MSKSKHGYRTRLSGLMKVTRPYLPHKARTALVMNRFMIEFLKHMGQTPTAIEINKSEHKNANHCQMFYNAYIDYIKSHPESLYIKPE